MSNNSNVYIDFQQNVKNFKKSVLVRFQVNKVDLLGVQEFPNGFWYPIRVHVFATQGMFCLLYIKKVKYTTLWLDDLQRGVEFTLVGKYISIYSQIVDEKVQIEYEVLLKAWKDFTEKVKHITTKCHPEFALYPDWALLTNDSSNYLESILIDPVRHDRIIDETKHLWFEEDTFCNEFTEEKKNV